jgi:hypothetical protein
MTLSKKLATYTHIKTVLDAVVDGGRDATYTLPTERDAMRWRHEAYYYRKLLLERGATTPYDNMTFRIEGPTVHIIFNKATGVLKIDNEIVTPADAQLTIAFELAKELKNP